MYAQVRSEAGNQVSAQQKRAVAGLYTLSDEVGKMADQGGQSGPATDLAHQAADKISQVAQWLEHREPGHVLDEVKDFARRRPGVFFAGAAVLGVLAGRLTKNLTPDSSTKPDPGFEGSSAINPAATSDTFLEEPGLGVSPEPYPVDEARR